MIVDQKMWFVSWLKCYYTVSSVYYSYCIHSNIGRFYVV